MMDITTIYQGAERFINEIIKHESTAQGHYLTGAMEDSIAAEVSKKGKADVMEGFAVYYTQFVNEGVPAESISMKQFPFLFQYFKKRGLPDQEAKGAAAATIKTWMKEGMSTQASKRFSQTGSRQNFVENAIAGNESRIDDYMGAAFDFAVEEEFQKEKSETI
jgi:hypothetical protein